MTDIITLGELLIDLTQRGSDENGNGEFTAYPGGAPANVAVAASRLGATAGFIGKVGKGSHTYLMSPMAAMASAVNGVITDPRKYL